MPKDNREFVFSADQDPFLAENMYVNYGKGDTACRRRRAGGPLIPFISQLPRVCVAKSRLKE